MRFKIKKKAIFVSYDLPVGEYFIRIDKAFFDSVQTEVYTGNDIWSRVTIKDEKNNTLAKINSENNRVEFIVK